MAPEQIVGEHPVIKIALTRLDASQSPKRLDAVPEGSLQPFRKVVIYVSPYPPGLDMLGFRQHVFNRRYVGTELVGSNALGGFRLLAEYVA